MKLVKVLHSEGVNENLQIAADRLVVLLGLKEPKERHVYIENIELRMEGLLLSDWFTLFIHCVFKESYETNQIRRDRLLDSVANLRLNKFCSEYHSIPNRVSLLRVKKNIFFQESPEAERVNEELINRLLKIHSQPSGERLAIFLLVAKIVSYLERVGKLSSEATAHTLNRMSKEPRAFIADIVPILLALQAIAPDDEESVALPILDRAIDATLKLLGFLDDNTVLMLLVQADLLEQQHIILTEATPVEMDHADQIEPSPLVA